MPERTDEASHRKRVTHLPPAEGYFMLDALVTAVNTKDRYTRRHSEGVMRYAVALARRMRLGAEAERQIELAARLHDVGKIAIPDYILRKPGKLTDAEYETMKQHALMGAIMVDSTLGFKDDVVESIRHHHERWGWSGISVRLGR